MRYITVEEMARLGVSPTCKDHKIWVFKMVSDNGANMKAAWNKDGRWVPASIYARVPFAGAKSVAARTTSRERRRGSSKRPCSRAARMTHACRSSTGSRRSMRFGESGTHRTNISLPRAYPPLPLARGRHTNLSKMTPKERGTTLGKFRSEYIVYGDFECQEQYILATSAYWVPLSKLTKNVTRATALDEIEIFEANMAELRANEFDELSSSEEDDVDDE